MNARENLEELRKAHVVLLEKAEKTKSLIRFQLNRHLVCAHENSYNKVNDYNRLLEIRDQLHKYYEEFRDDLGALIESEAKVVQATKEAKHYRCENNYTSQSLQKLIEDRYGSVRSAIKELGLTNNFYRVLLSKASVGVAGCKKLSSLLGVNIAEYLDEHGRLQQEDE